MRRGLTTVLCATIVAATAGCQRNRDTATERNKLLVQRWFEEGFNQRRLTVVDELFAEQVSIDGQVIPRDAIKQNMSRHLSGFPDLHIALNDIVAEGIKVDVWYTAEGTHRGTFEGVAPTGQRVTWTGVDSFTIDDERILAARFLYDLHSLLTQLNVRNP
jgi:steroid delta-isomerase-like uncharacterized protein